MNSIKLKFNIIYELVIKKKRKEKKKGSFAQRNKNTNNIRNEENGEEVLVVRW